MTSGPQGGQLTWQLLKHSCQYHCIFFSFQDLIHCCNSGKQLPGQHVVDAHVGAHCHLFSTRFGSECDCWRSLFSSVWVPAPSEVDATTFFKVIFAVGTYNSAATCFTLVNSSAIAFSAEFAELSATVCAPSTIPLTRAPVIFHWFNVVPSLLIWSASVLASVDAFWAWLTVAQVH